MINLLSYYDADISIINTRNFFDTKNISAQKIENKEIYEFTADEALNNLVDDKYINSGLMDKLFKKKLFSGLTFPEGRKFEDAALMHILLSRAKKTVFTTEEKYNYFYRIGSITHRYSVLNEYERFLAHQERFDFFLKTNRTNLIPKEAKIVFLDAVKVQEMGIFHKKNAVEKSMISETFHWSQHFIQSKEKDYISGDLIKRFEYCNGNFINKIYILFKFELKTRLKYFFLINLPKPLINTFRGFKGVIFSCLI
jgi:hypothetical protein